MQTDSILFCRLIHSQDTVGLEDPKVVRTFSQTHRMRRMPCLLAYIYTYF